MRSVFTLNENSEIHIYLEGMSCEICWMYPSFKTCTRIHHCYTIITLSL